MKKKKIIGIILAAVLVAGGLGCFAFAQGDPVNDVNIAEVSYSTMRLYTAPENTFRNREVTGNTWWQAELWNLPDATGEPIAGAELSLDSDLALDCYSVPLLIDSIPIYVEPTQFTQGPPTYEWAFGDLLEGKGGLIFVHPTNPADEVLGTFTPGFNVSVSVDKFQFLQSEGTQTQTLTIKVEKVDPEACFLLAVFTDESPFPFLPVDEGDLVEAVIIPPFPERTDSVFPGRTGFVMDTMHMEADETRVIEVPIEVTPKVPRVEYKPAVWLASQRPYPERGSYLGSFHSFEVDSLGTWIWNAEGEYDWQWRDVDRGAVVFPGIPPAIEDFAIEHMFIDFEQRPKLDKIVGKASFHLKEDATYDLDVDDVAVSIDGVLITIPAGSFKKEGQSGERYIYESTEGVEPKILMKLDLDEGEWSLKIHDIDASAINSYDGVDVAFCIGYMAARESIDMQIGGLSYIAEE